MCEKVCCAAPADPPLPCVHLKPFLPSFYDIDRRVKNSLKPYSFRIIKIKKKSFPFGFVFLKIFSFLREIVLDVISFRRLFCPRASCTEKIGCGPQNSSFLPEKIILLFQRENGRTKKWRLKWGGRKENEPKQKRRRRVNGFLIDTEKLLLSQRLLPRRHRLDCVSIKWILWLFYAWEFYRHHWRREKLSFGNFMFLIKSH